MMKLIGGVPTTGFTDVSYFLVLLGTFGLGLQVQLHLAFHILTKFSSFVIDISFN
jgi:hypothetical protein